MVQRAEADCAEAQVLSLRAVVGDLDVRVRPLLQDGLDCLLERWLIGGENLLELRLRSRGWRDAQDLEEPVVGVNDSSFGVDLKQPNGNSLRQAVQQLLARPERFLRSHLV